MDGDMDLVEGLSLAVQFSQETEIEFHNNTLYAYALLALRSAGANADARQICTSSA